MNVFQFVRSMLPSFKRNDVSERIRLIRGDLVNETIPPYETTVADYKSINFTAPPVVAFEKEFSKYVSTEYRGKWFEVVLQVLKNLQNNFDFIESLVQDNYANDIVVEGLTYKRAQILQYIALAGFVSDYSRQVLLYLLVCEANLKARALPDGKERPLPEIKWLLENRTAYFRALNAMSLREKELAAVLDDIPDIVVTEDSAELVAETVGRHKVDPMNFNIIPIGKNPFHFIGIRWANWQVAKYQRAKEEKRALEFRLEQLRCQRNGTEDPRLEKSIAYYEEEVNRLAVRLAKMEE